MKVATLVKKNNDDCWYCSNCMIRQFYARPYCHFCGAEISNIEEVWLEDHRVKEENKVKENKADISF